MMTMRMSVAPSESDDSIARRARVLAFQISRGEFVAPPAHDPVWRHLFDMIESGPRVPHGNALGAIPEAL